MFKPNIAPTTLDQYAHQQEYTKAPKSGEKVIMDPEATIQCIILVFDGLMNVGAFFALATYILREGCWLLAPKFYTWTLVGPSPNIIILSYIIYLKLRKYKMKFGRINRITFGFILATISGVIRSFVQRRVYESSPCGYDASSCSVGIGVSPISILRRLSNVSLGAIPGASATSLRTKLLMPALRKACRQSLCLCFCLIRHWQPRWEKP